ncbi:tetratricopeptide repeat protein [Phormidesmis sp. 146-12]
MKNFFVSYNRHDRAFAEWIAWILEEAGYSVVIQAWDFRSGGNFVLDMQKAASEAERTIAVLSDNYLQSLFTQPEWAAAFAQDPTGEKRTLIPIRVGECKLTGILATIVYVDLVGVDEAEAQELVRQSALDGRTKPTQKPGFPGSVAPEATRSKPVYPLSIPANLPLVSKIFVGRDEDLATLHEQLQSRETIAISSITGMGGIGKTELAAQYALEQRDLGTYPGGICWLKAREDVGSQIVLFARSHFNFSIPDDLELAQKVAWCWRKWEQKETLIVLDDVQAYEDVKPFLPPQRSQFKVLMTTRSRFGHPVQNYEIKVLSEGQSLELLRAIVQDSRVDQDLATAKQVCEWLGYLPLGLELVGRYLAKKWDVSIGLLWQRLQDKKLFAQALLKAESGMTASLGVTAAFELSWQDLDQNAQQLAALLSLFALAEIPWELVEACLPEEDAEALEDLRDDKLLGLSLLERTGQEMYQLHQLLREFFAVKREQMAEVEEWKRSFCRVMVTVAETIPYVATLSIIKKVTSAIPHVEEAATTLEPWLADSDVMEPSRRIGWFYKGQGAYAKALSWLKDCSEIVEKRLGNNHPDVAYSLNSLAALHEIQGCHTKAEFLYLKSLDIWQQQGETDRSEVAACLNNLAGLYLTQGRYVEAERLCIQSLRIDRQYYGNAHPEVATDLNTLAELYRLQSRYTEAELLLTESLKIQQNQLGDDDIALATTLNNLSLLSHDQGRYEDAEVFKLKSIDIEKKHLSSDHPQVAVSLNNLAELYRRQGRNSDAEPLYIESLKIMRKHLGNNHLKVAMLLNNLSLLYLDQERYEKAESYKLRSLEIEENNLGSEYPQITTSLNNLALIYQAQKRYVEAELTYGRSIEAGQRQLDDNHPDIARSLSNLAGLYTSLGRYAEAEPLFHRAIGIYYEQLGEAHPDTQGVWQDFVIFLVQAIKSDRTTELSDHPMTQALLQQLRAKNDSTTEA